MPDLRARYLKRLNQEGWSADEGQSKAVGVLDKLLKKLKKKKSFWSFRKNESAQGVYLYGGVGRGKSMLMDLFYEAVPADIKKRRVHFHAFMIETHDWLHQNRGQDMDDLLSKYADHTAKNLRVLCFDEFHVVDVADAMILARLFTALIEQGVVIISTSNWMPDNLYEGGLQRDLFLPFIALIKQSMRVVHLDSDNDYRMLADTNQNVYFFCPLNDDTENKVNSLFEQLSEGKKSSAKKIKVKGRVLEIMASKNIARCSFEQLCGQPLGAEDYIKIASKFQTIFVENIPQLSSENRNEVKRFILLIDCLYEAECRLIMSAQNDIHHLYEGHDHAFEFDRTVSRLMEMQSSAYNKSEAAV